ncbi:hypothetical protein I6F07_17595 [Ensifer sp. IC4062]|nr:hypothetical protein [Ensifer sp. IC4062]MCA1441996.1 hypothetical protein [Ensifer sp. IC4062]
MREFTLHQQKHGYRNGHQLLESTVRLERSDQDTIDRLSDLSGQIRPGEVIPSYLTIYPLPSRVYHVVARTWPDLAAPRAGCVLTKSLLIPRELWSENADLPELLRRLAEPELTELAPLARGTATKPLPPASDARAPELVEALFLEARKPIVVFEARDADLIATRLVTAFWPAFRSEFSLCTYALGPRKISGRDFDLVFAPKNARSKFSDWSGRKIEGGVPKNARHRWSSAVANAIFQSSHPTLASGDALGLLGAEGPGDEAAFRKSLLWNELAEKAPTSASAVLGMLDIINSQPSLASNAMRGSLPSLNAAISSAVATMSSAEAWSFLQTLSGKVHGRDALDILSIQATNDAKRLATSNPEAAIEFSQRFRENQDVFPIDIMRGLADGLGAAKEPAIDYQSIPPRVGTFLIASSSAFTELLARHIRTGETPASAVVPYLQTDDRGWRDAAAKRLVNVMDSAEFAPLLPSILNHSSGKELSDKIIAIVARSGLAFSEFDEALVDAIRDDTTMQAVRNIVARDLPAQNADRFLSKTIHPVPSDVEWLFDGPIEGPRSATLLAAAISSQNDRSVIEAQRDSIIRRKMLDILARDVGVSATEMARILLLGSASADDLIQFGQIALDALPNGRLHSDLVKVILERALSQAQPTDSRVERLVISHFDEVGARQIVRWSTGDGIGTPRLAQNLLILTRLPENQRRPLATFVDNLAYRLSRREPKGLDREVCASWARLLLEARTFSPRNHLRAATTSLSATIDLTRSPVAEVLAAAFPAVYHELVSRDDDDRSGMLGMLYAIPRMLVYDWDRAKPARHRLVDAFMNSDWPPSYLLLTAARAGITDRICLRVLRQRGGKKFLNRAIADLPRLPQEDVEMIRKDLNDFDDVAMKDEWD